MKSMIRILKKPNEEKIIVVFTYLFGILFILQYLAVIYINLFQNDSILGYDASTSYLKAIEMSRQKTIFPAFYEQTVLGIDSPIPIAALFYHITGNIFVSYGIANILLISVLLLVCYSLLKMMPNQSPLGMIIPLNILLTPFIVTLEILNPISDLYSSLSVSSAFLSVKMLIGMICIRSFIRLNQKAKINLFEMIVIVISFFLTFVSGFSAGLQTTATFLLPVLAAWVLYKVMEREAGLKSFLYVISAISFSLLGRFIAYRYLQFTASDSKMLVGARDYHYNLGAIYSGFVEYFGGMDPLTGTEVFTRVGIMYVMNFAFIHFFLIMILMIIHRKFKENFSFQLPDFTYFSIIWVNLFIFLVCCLTYSGGVFEVRYFTPLFLCMVLLFSEAINHKLATWIKTFRTFILLCLFIFLCATNIFSQYVYAKESVKPYYDHVNDILDKYDEKIVFGTEGVFIRNMRVYDLSKAYKLLVLDDKGNFGGYTRWGDYVRYENEDTYWGPTLLITVEEIYDKLPLYIRQNYIYQEAVGDGSIIYRSEGNYFDFPDGYQ
jgi:hypothetical protein